MVFLARKMKGAFGGSTCIDHGAFQDRNESKALWGVILSKEVIHQRLEKVKHNFSKNKYSKTSLAVQVMVIMPKNDMTKIEIIYFKNTRNLIPRVIPQKNVEQLFLSATPYLPSKRQLQFW